MVLAAWSAALALGLAQDARPQDPPADPAPPEAASTLDDVVIQGTLREQVARFVDEVAAAPKGRFLAAWRDRVCPGVVNLEPVIAQAVLDRISDVAAELDVETGRPGCDPNVVIVFTNDGSALATAMVERQRRVFDHPNVGAFNRGEGALDQFTSSAAPVRWWHLSMPVDAVTRRRTVRLSNDLLPALPIAADGLLGVGTVDVLYKVIIVVDVDLTGQVSLAQLADYLAMVSLAQIEPEAQVDDASTILNVFRRPTATAGLTDWDRSYLQAVYSSVSRRRNPDSRNDDVARLMYRDQNRDLVAGEPEPAPSPQ